MKLKNVKVILALMLITSSLIPLVSAPTVTVSPVDSDDDAFITGIGAYFGDTPFIFLRDSTQNLVIGNRFRSVTIPQGSKINNATLFVRSIYTYDAGTNISVTITGDASDNSAPFNDSSSFSRVYTGAYVVWNISDVNGNAWFNVTVTEIVQEIIDRIGWTSGNALSLVMFTDQGTPRREYVSVDGNPTFTAFLNITYAESPASAPIQDQATPPYNDTDDYTWELNDTYRGFDIWEVHDENRTGYSANVNWNLLNMTQLTEIDSGLAISVNNDTWTSLSAFQAQQINCLYNDTGAAAINSFYVRFAVNVTEVTNTLGGGSEWVCTLAGLSTATPVGAAGLGLGAGGSWVGLELLVNVDDTRYLLRMGERFGAGVVHDLVNTGWLTENTNQVLYIVYMYRTGSGFVNWTSVNVFTDPDFESGIFSRTYQLTVAQPPFRYAQIIASTGPGSLAFLNSGEYYTYSESPIDNGTLIFVSYPNGTLVDPDPIPRDADPEDYIDDLLGGPLAEDPEEDKYTGIDKFRWKLLVLAVGLIMMLGVPTAGIYYGASTATWIKILFIAFFGLGILWQIKFM
jgi:hypothetical protein